MEGCTTLLLCYIRGFEGRDHCYTILVSLKRRGLEEDIGRYTNLKAYKCKAEHQISGPLCLRMKIGDTEFIFVDLSHLSEIPNLGVSFHHKTLVIYASCFI